jgi:hypothetical protein
MLVNILAGILGILLFLFVFWKRLKEDYSSIIIFQTSAAILTGIGLGWLLSRLFFQTWFCWTSALFAVLSMGLMLAKFKLRFYETFEALIMAVMPWLALIFLVNSVVASSLTSFLAFTAILVMIFASYYLDVNYKSFTWYRSGRIGFAGLSVGIILFLARTVLAIFSVAMLSFVGKFELVLSGAMTLVCSILLFNLGRNKK